MPNLLIQIGGPLQRLYRFFSARPPSSNGRKLLIPPLVSAMQVIRYSHQEGGQNGRLSDWEKEELKRRCTSHASSRARGENPCHVLPCCLRSRGGLTPRLLGIRGIKLQKDSGMSFRTPSLQVKEAFTLRFRFLARSPSSRAAWQNKQRPIRRFLYKFGDSITAWNFQVKRVPNPEEPGNRGVLRKDPEYSKVDPLGKLPAFKDGDVEMIESGEP
jgi:hypothetical protein